jgi:sterol desaturase/sphingolipid hydroxylase (fatty acid hydroxylase superfamily)
VRLDSSPVAGWPLLAQVAVFLVLADFLQWCIHNLLHRVPWLWTFHKVHHSIDTMDWIGNFRFHWMEIVVYKALQWLPLAWLNASSEAVLAVAVVTTIWGDLNHSNLDVGLGPLGYLLNSPRMHLWHHDQSTEGGVAKNFGIVFSVWDFLFGTAYWPRERSPLQIGYPGDGEMPRSLPGQLLWPLARRSVTSGREGTDGPDHRSAA